MEPTSTPNAVSRADFARLKNVNRSTITRWADAGRVVLDGDGNVLIAETEALLADTADPEKAGVVDRHAEERGSEVRDLLTPTAKSKAAKPTHYGDRIRESARHEAAKAERAEIELARLKGDLADVAGVQKAMVDFATMSREKYSRLAFDLKFKLAAESDPTTVFTVLKDALEATAREISATMKAQLEAGASTQQ